MRAKGKKARLIGKRDLSDTDLPEVEEEGMDDDINEDVKGIPHDDDEGMSLLHGDDGNKPLTFYMHD